ncbi:hypothetical protein B5S29_g2612 [[Candida] boidinii]|nr:hypothetical protein B5S29_g2612 [[Candida] boidinii]
MNENNINFQNLSEINNIKLNLKKFLLELPVKNNFQFDEFTQFEIRKNLSNFITFNEKYLNLLYHENSISEWKSQFNENKGNNGNENENENDDENDIDTSSSITQGNSSSTLNQNSIHNHFSNIPFYGNEDIANTTNHTKSNRIKDERQQQQQNRNHHHHHHHSSDTDENDDFQNIIPDDEPWVPRDSTLDKEHPNRPCARKLQRGDPCYRCLTCGVDELCALCESCFFAQDHTGHKIFRSVRTRDNGAVCDCGDPEAWLADLHCKHGQSIPLITLSDEFKENLSNCLCILLDYVIDVISHSFTMFVPPQTEDEIKSWSESSNLNFHKYNGLDVNSEYYSLVMYNDEIHQQRDGIQRVQLATGKVKDFATMIIEATGEIGKSKVMISKDIGFLLERQNILTSTGITACIRSCRDEFRENMCDQILSWIHSLAHSHLFANYIELRELICKIFLKKWNQGINSFNMEEEFVESLEISDMSNNSNNNNNNDFNHNLNDNNNSTTSGNNNGSKRSSWRNLKTVNSIKLINNHIPNLKLTETIGFNRSWNISNDICNDCDYDASFDRNSNPFIGSRFQYLAYFDIRFSKLTRSIIHDLFLYSLLSCAKFKPILTAQYVDIYPHLAQMFLVVDREPEGSMLPAISFQLFTNPSCASLTVDHGDIVRVLSLIYNYLTLENSDNIFLPSTNPNNGTILGYTPNLIIPSLRNRKWGHLFIDLSYIITRDKFHTGVFRSSLIFQFLKILSLFQSLPTYKREANNHVEYEMNDYALYFNALSVVCHFGENIGKLVAKLGNDEQDTIKFLTQDILKIISNFIHTDLNENIEEKIIDETTQKLVINNKLKEDQIFYHDITLDGENYHSIVQFDLLSEKVSFSHPLHFFLSWFIGMNLNIETPQDLINLINIPSVDILGILDFPLRTIVFLSQIKVGLWVRNGSIIKNQMNVYRNSGVREFGFLRDLFLTHLFIATQPVEISLSTIIDRWGLINFVKGNFQEEHNQLGEFIEEFILFFINIFNEDMLLHRRSSEEILNLKIRKEIIHAICLKPLCYSELISHISDHIVNEKKFFVSFNQVVEGVSSNQLKENKVYRLKEEYYDEIDPYYIHYSSNKREESIKLLKERIHKSKKIPTQNIYLEPRVVDWSTSPYRNIINISCSKYFTLILQSTLEYCIKFNTLGANNENLLESLLYLIHMCITLPNSEDFIKNYMTLRTTRFKSIIEYFYDILKLGDDFRFCQQRIKHILQKIQNENLFNLSELIDDYNPELIETVSKKNNDSIDKKKRLAERKKSKLFAKMKKQQEKFLQNSMMDSNNINNSHNSNNNNNNNNSNNNETMDVDTDNYHDEDDDESSDSVGWCFPEEHCILCQMPADDEEPFGIISYIFESGEFRDVPFEDEYWFYKSFSGNLNLDEEDDDLKLNNAKVENYLKSRQDKNIIGPGFPCNSHNDITSIATSCCHGMHFSCYVTYLKSNKNRITSLLTKTLPEDVSRNEFLCPLCKAVNNIFIPVFYSSNNKSLDSHVVDDSKSIMDPGFDDFLNNAESEIEEIKKEIVDVTQAKIKPKFASQFDHFNPASKAFGSLIQAISILSILCIPLEGISALLARTIDSVETSLRGCDSNSGLVIFQLNSQMLTNLRVWCQLRDLVRVSESKIKNNIQSSNLLLYPERLVGLLKILISDDSCIIEGEDFFKDLVIVEEVKDHGLSYHKLVHLVYIKHIIQSLITIFAKIDKYGDTYDNSTCNIFDLFDNELNEKYIPSDLVDSLDKLYEIFEGKKGYGKVIYVMLIKLVTPFLRKVAIYSFVRYATVDKLPSLELRLEADKICSLLNLPFLNEIVNSFLQDPSIIDGLYNRGGNSGFANKSQVKEILSNSRVGYPNKVELVELPQNLHSFFKIYNEHRNKRTGDPGICLFCGAIVELQTHSYGNKLGACNMHCTWECMNGYGMFLLPRANAVLILYKDKGSFFESPYIDDHGECDEDGKRGHDLHLSKYKYEDLIRNFWLQHNIPNQIARKLDPLGDIGGWSTL